MSLYRTSTENNLPESPSSGTRRYVAVLLGALVLIALIPYPAIDFLVAGFAGAYIWSQFNSKFLPMMIAGFVSSGFVFASLFVIASLRPATGHLIGSFQDWLAIPLIHLYSIPGALLAFILARSRFKTRNNKTIAE